jgi:hypothetical protein
VVVKRIDEAAGNNTEKGLYMLATILKSPQSVETKNKGAADGN